MTPDASSVTLTPQQQHRLAVLNRLVARHCTAAEAATLLGMSERQVWRLKAAYQQDGAAALIHGNRDRSTPWALTDAVREQVRSLVADRYAGCNDAHIAELLAREHQIFLSRASVRRILRSAGSPAPHPRRAPRHRRRRERFAQAGMLLQIDGSPHAWFGPDQPRCTLLAAIDDATSSVVAAVFRAQEDAHGYLLLLRQVLTTQGIPDALYHDRHGIFQRTPHDRWTRAEEFAGAQDPTQFGRVLGDLGIGSIPARSPQAKGRIERLWGTLQDRLVVELRLAGIATPQAVTADFLATYFDRHNAVFAVPATIRARPTVRSRRRSIWSACSASATGGRSITTTPSNSTVRCSRSRPARAAAATPRRACGCMRCSMAPWASGMTTSSAGCCAPMPVPHR